jgi:hypothetical protein
MPNPLAKPIYQRLFWLCAIGLTVGGLLLAESLLSWNTLAGFAIGFTALLPSYLWVRGSAHGLPIFPIVALFYVNTHAIPFIIGHPGVAKYSEIERLIAAGTVIAYLLLATVVWCPLAVRRNAQKTQYTGFAENRSGGIFIGFLVLGCFFVSPLPWYVFPSLPYEFQNALKMAFLGLAILSAAVLGFQWGAKRLSWIGKVLFAGFLSLYMLIDSSGLMVHSSFSLVITVSVTYTLARGRLPLLLLAFAIPILALLHLGKWQMRETYWGDRPQRFPGYVEFYADWIDYGIAELRHRDDEIPSRRKPKRTSALERASVIQMLLLVETRSPEPVPFMLGESYRMIPELLVPRFVNPDKPWAHEGTYRLTTHYGIQTRAQTLKTTIGFGPLAESYANFGFFGVALLAILTGWVSGRVAGWGIDLPITSFPGLFGLLTISALSQTESTMAVIVNSLFQGTMALVVIRLLFMRTLRNATEATPLVPRPAAVLPRPRLHTVQTQTS